MSNLKENNFRFEGYDEYLYTGIQGLMMRQNHRILSQNISNSLNRKILDIGGGAKPHTSIVDLKGVSEYWVSDSYKVFKKNKSLENKTIKQHIYEDDPNYEFFHKNKITFSRIIASHVWEHVDYPEDELLKWVSLLDEDGQLDIAIPCDPGWAWRLGQLIGRRKAVQTYKMSSDAIDLMMTREHVNSCQNLVRIIKYYTKSKGKYFPFYLPLIDINLFIFFRLKKNDFIY